MRKLIMPLGLVVLIGCGGQGGPAAVQNPSFSVIWPERTRNIAGPDSALSGRARFRNVKGQDVVVNFNRDSNTSSHTEIYNVDQNLYENTKDFEVTFYTGQNQTGDVIAEGSGEVTWGDSRMVGAITLGNKVKQVFSVTPTQILVDEPAYEMSFVARDENGTNLAVTPGSAKWSVVSGDDVATITPDGTITALKAGTITVKVTIDGTSSADDDIPSALPPIVVNTHVLGYPKGWNAQGDIIGMHIGEDTGWDYVPGTWQANSPGFTAYAGVPENYSVAKSYDGSIAATGGEYAHVWADPAGASTATLTGPDSGYSQVFVADATTQAGQARVGSTYHAYLWHGTTESGVDLHPNAGYQSSQVNGFWSNTQVGVAIVNGTHHAAMWQGTAGSFVDMHPAGMRLSQIYHCNSQYQVGRLRVNDFFDHASVWTGTAASATDLDPGLSGMSEAYFVAGKYAVGVRDSEPTIWNLETRAHRSLLPECGNGSFHVIRLTAKGDAEVLGLGGNGMFSVLVPRSQLP